MARRSSPSFRAVLFRCGEGAVCEPSRLEDRQLRELVFLSVQKATLGSGGRGPQAPSVLQGPAVSVWRRRRLWALAAGRQLRELVFLSVQKATLGSAGRGLQARSVLQGPPVSVWRRRRLWAFAAGRQLRELVFLSVQKATLGSGGRGPQARSFRALLFRCGEGAVCEPSRLEDRQLIGTGGRGPQARSVLQGRAVSVWRRRRLWALAAGRQLRELVFLSVQKQC